MSEYTMTDGLRFSVAMSIYKNDDPGYLRTAIRSTYRQTLPPSEVVMGQGVEISLFSLVLNIKTCYLCK